jgi:hypothetical protein
MKISGSKAGENYSYGPYTLQKRTQKVKRVQQTVKQPSAPKKVTKVAESVTSVKVVDAIDTQEVLIEFSTINGTSTKKNKKKTLDHVTTARRNVMKGNKAASATNFNEMVDAIIKQVNTIEIEGKGELVKKLIDRKIPDDKIKDMKFGIVTDDEEEDEDGSETSEDEDGSDSDEEEEDERGSDSHIDDEEEDESGDGKDQKQDDRKDSTTPLTEKALSAHVEKVTNGTSAPSEPNDATAAKGLIYTKKKDTSDDAGDATTKIAEVGKSTKTQTTSKAKSAKKKGAKTEREGGKEKTTVMVHIDCWFYTGIVTNGTEKNDIETLIKSAAVDEGVLDDHELANVRATTTTITGSALCISSSLLSTAIETALSVAEDQVDSAHDHHRPVYPSSFGAKQKADVDVIVVDFSGFNDRACLIKYIQSNVPVTLKGKESVEAIVHGPSTKASGAFGAGGDDDGEGAGGDDEDVAGTDPGLTTQETGESVHTAENPAAGSVTTGTSTNEKKVWIFYTVEPVEDNGRKKEGKKNKAKKDENAEDPLNGATISTKNGTTKIALRKYVPEVLANSTVLDAMVDLVVRCVDDPPDYETSCRVVQTIMLSDTRYDHDETATNTRLVSMDKPKPVSSKPNASEEDAQEIDKKPTAPVGFGNDMPTLIPLIQGALYYQDGILNSAESIVKELYNIKLDTPLFSFSDFYSVLATAPIKWAKTLKVSNKDTDAINTVDRASDFYGLFMYPAVDANYMVVATKKNTGRPGKQIAYIFKLKESPGNLEREDIFSLASQIGKDEFDDESSSNSAITKSSAIGLIRTAQNLSVQKIQTQAAEKAKAKAKAPQKEQGKTKVLVFKDVGDIYEHARNKIRAIRILLTRKLGEETKKILNAALGALNAGVNETMQQRQPQQKNPQAQAQPKTAQQPQLKTPQQQLQLQQQPQADHAGSAPKISADKVVSNIQTLDELFLQYELNPGYEWGNKELNERLNGLRVPVRNYNWHGDRSLQRIVAQYAAFEVEDQFTVLKKVKTFVLFSTRSKKKYTTSRLLQKYNKVNTPEKKIELHEHNKALYYTCLFVTALRDQNFGALFTSQPNFSTKPVNDDKPDNPYYDKEYDKQRPNCGTNGGNSPIEDGDPDEKTVDLFELGKAVSLVKGLIESGVLIKRNHTKELLDCNETLEKLDGMLQEIKPENIGEYTSGGAGESTKHEPMLRQSMKCFVLFLPLIERMVRKKHPNESNDFIRSKALSYGCVSHGLDPKHIIAVRYAMHNDQTTYESRSYPLSRKICKELFGLLEEESAGPDSFPLTRELMRTRVLGAITVIEDVQTREPSKFGMRSFV